MTIKNQDALQFLKEQPDNSADILFCDPPYALGSEIIIRPDGKVDYKKASDFMNKWDMPTGEFWEEFYSETMRVLKHGGHCLMFGMDRQLLLFKYYAHLAGLTEKQSLYWYFISNFPKATDLSKMIDKNAGAEREVISTQKVPDTRGDAFSTQNDKQKSSYDNIEVNITAPSTPLAKKYSGYKYSIAPLKQTNETVMVFQKPYKTKSGLHDTLAMENGDDSITCGALDIDGNRVTSELPENRKRHGGGSSELFKERGNEESYPSARYPSQTFCDSGTAKVLAEQSGVSKSTGGRIGNKGSDLNMMGTNYQKGDAGYGDIAGCSKILHKCDDEQDNGDHWLINNRYAIYKNDGCIYDTVKAKDIPQWVFSYRDLILHKCDFEDGEYDIYFYNPKVSKSERNAGCEEMEEKVGGGIQGTQDQTLLTGSGNLRNNLMKNNHPTLKPISLIERILKPFKTPNEQTILIPFAGAGSEMIGAYKAGFENIIGCEINPEYVEIAQARIKHWCK